jgi:pyruvate kinase
MVMSRKTKIIATLGPATESPEVITQLIKAGLNIVRLNMSHANHDWVRIVVPRVREIAAAAESRIGILLDTQGPAIRTGDLPVPLKLKPGQKFVLTVRGEKSEEEHSVDVNYENFVNDINVGDTVLIDNGQIEMRVLAKNGNKVECEVLTPGTLGSRRHINLPGVKVSLPALTEKDLRDVQLGLELGVEYVALSFVREAADLHQLREVVESAAHPPLVVAKIEDQQAIKNLEAIIDASDAVMVARGDLGIEVPYQELPIIQRRIVRDCLKVGKPVIVATHMLESMIQNPVPTRAEVTDVANAVFEQADAIMLSGETSVGRYPIRCVEVFHKIAERTELSGGARYHEQAQLTEPREKLVKSGVRLADELKADVVVVFTIYGLLARFAAWQRPRYSPIYAICPSEAVANSLILLRGVTPVVVEFDFSDPEKTIDVALALLRQRGVIAEGDSLVIIGAISSGGTIVDAVQMRVVGSGATRQT